MEYKGAEAAQRIFEEFRRATEDGDGERLRSLYADDFVLIGYSQTNPPSRPLKLEGVDRIEDGLRNVFDREPERQRAGYPAPSWPACECLSRRISNEVITENRFSYLETCDLGGELHCVAAVTAELRDGRIVRETIVETLDEERARA